MSVYICVMIDMYIVRYLCGGQKPASRSCFLPSSCWTGVSLMAAAILYRPGGSLVSPSSLTMECWVCKQVLPHLAFCIGPRVWTQLFYCCLLSCLSGPALALPSSVQMNVCPGVYPQPTFVDPGNDLSYTPGNILQQVWLASLCPLIHKRDRQVATTELLLGKKSEAIPLSPECVGQSSLCIMLQ